MPQEPELSSLVKQDKWIDHAIDELKRDNAYRLDDAVDKGFAELKQITAFGLFLFVLIVVIWMLWSLKNMLKIDLFPGRDFNLMEDIDKIMTD